MAGHGRLGLLAGLGLVLAIALGASVVVAGAQGTVPAANGSPAAGTPCAAASPAASPMAATMASPAASPAAGCARIIHVTAQAYKFTPNTFNLTVGQPVTFVIHSADIFHTFTVKQSKSATDNIFSVDITPGSTESYTWTPTKPGDYYLYCIPHEALGMTGTIHVTG